MRNDPTVLRRLELTTEQTTSALLLKGLCFESLPGKEGESEKAYSLLIDTAKPDSLERRIGLLRRGKLRFNAKKYAEAKTDLANYIGNKDAKNYDPSDLEAVVLSATCKKELKDAAGFRSISKRSPLCNSSGFAGFEVPFQLGNFAYEAGKHVLMRAAQYCQAARCRRAAQGSFYACPFQPRG